MEQIKVDVFSSPGCDRCAKVFELMQEVTQELGGERIAWRAVNVLDELDYAVELGVLSLPAIAINGELVFTSHPSTDTLRAALESRLQAQTA